MSRTRARRIRAAAISVSLAAELAAGERDAIEGEATEIDPCRQCENLWADLQRLGREIDALRRDAADLRRSTADLRALFAEGAVA